jgi:ATP-dependent protease HslVU (ClpYQ) peptidase subunit
MQSLQRRLLHYTLRLLCYNTQIAQAGDAKVWKTDRVLARLQVLLLVDASEDQTS